MPECFNLSLGGICISLNPDISTGEFFFGKREIDFISNEEPEITLQVHCGWFPRLRKKETVPTFKTNVSWELYRIDGKYVFKTGSTSRFTRLLGLFPPDFRSGNIHVTSLPDNQSVYRFPLDYPMGELYMMNLLGTGLGILCHAAGVIDNGIGFLFAGQGGAGKTTISKLFQSCPGVRVVNDDKVILRKAAGEYRLYGTPWHGQGGMALPDSAPIKKIFILKQAPQNSITTLSASQATSSLLTRAFVPLWDADKMAFILKFLGELCQEVPCLELGFLPDVSVIRFIQDLI